MSAGDYVHASRRRLTMIAAVEDVLRQVDVLLCASAMDPPSRIDEAKEVERTYPRQARTPFNVTGHPALANHWGNIYSRPVTPVAIFRSFGSTATVRLAI
jgi:aspartyl-tRNA(Asn)/glutamyl-tRNA(Gln) amidotransferase subunit A